MIAKFITCILPDSFLKYVTLLWSLALKEAVNWLWDKSIDKLKITHKFLKIPLYWMLITRQLLLL